MDKEVKPKAFHSVGNHDYHKSRNIHTITGATWPSKGLGCGQSLYTANHRGRPRGDQWSDTSPWTPYITNSLTLNSATYSVPVLGPRIAAVELSLAGRMAELVPDWWVMTSYNHLIGQLKQLTGFKNSKYCTSCIVGKFPVSLENMNCKICAREWRLEVIDQTIGTINTACHVTDWEIWFAEGHVTTSINIALSWPIEKSKVTWLVIPPLLVGTELPDSLFGLGPARWAHNQHSSQTPDDLQIKIIVEEFLILTQND